MNQKEFSQKPIEEKLDLIFKSTEKTRKYFLWTLIATIVMFVLPLIVFTIFIPQIISVYTNSNLSF